MIYTEYQQYFQCLMFAHKLPIYDGLSESIAWYLF